MYDTNNDGVLREDDLREVLKAMIIENGMEFNDEEVPQLPQRSIFLLPQVLPAFFNKIGFFVG